ncbi:MAG: hypothetical protein JW795_19425 [Chitinivibrionales bacterium]|nr:hypothetical protein [Chitinivibrionales bacterium]
MSNILKTVVLLIVMNFIATYALEYSINHMRGHSRLGDESIKTLMNEALKAELQKADYYEAAINVYAKKDAPEYWLVNIAHRNILQVDCFRLNIENSKVTQVIPNYIDTEYEEISSECPDPEIELLSTCSVPEFASCVKMADSVYRMGVKANLKSVRLPQKQDENLSAILGYLKCPKLKIWSRVGHGQTFGLYLGDNKYIKAEQINSLGTDVLKDKIIMATSCLAHQGEFEQSILNQKAKTFVSGDISVEVGRIEKVTLLFLNKIILQKKEIKQSFKEALSEGKYPGSFGISGNGPWYFWDSQTGLTPMAFTNGANDFAIAVMNNQNILFHTTVLSSKSTISIFTMDGKQLFISNPAASDYLWNMVASTGQKISAGNYVAVMSNGSTMIAKSFSVSR